MQRRPNPAITPLFDSQLPGTEVLEEGAVLLRGFVAAQAALLLEEVNRIAQSAAFRHLVTPSGHTMSVAMTNCGRFGWISDRTGYRYDPLDPQTGVSWPLLPALFGDVAARAAAEAGFPRYEPDACLINRYTVGAKLSLHRDRDEQDDWAPIVSVSLGVSALFLWGGKSRSGPLRRFQVDNGDVVVWGGPARFVYHGVAPLKAAQHPLTGSDRINLTFRKVL